MEALAVIEVLEKIESGMTTPFRCRLEDENLYAVKGRGALVKGLINEVVCGTLARHLDLPVPPFSIANVDTGLINAVEDREFRFAIGEGPAFASLWCEPAVPINRSRLINLDPAMLAKIYAFDHWTKNGDRSLTELGGNPNMLIDLRDNTLVIIDHNLAFSENYEPNELKVHACREAWLDVQRDLVFKQGCRADFVAAIGIVPEVMASLPDEWLDAEPNAERQILDTLARAMQTDFWEEM